MRKTAQQTIMLYRTSPAVLIILIRLIRTAGGTFMLKDPGVMFFYSNGHADEYKQTITLCASVGGSPPAVHSNADVDFIVSIANSGNAGVWLGADKVNDKSFKWSDHSVFDYASWADGQPFCDKYECSLILTVDESQSDRRTMKAAPIMEKHKQVCKIDLSDDLAIEKAYLSTLKNESGVMQKHDAEQLVKILFNDEISSVRTLVQRMTIRRVSHEAGQARVIACVFTILLAFVVFYIYKVQNNYLHLKQLTSEQRDVND